MDNINKYIYLENNIIMVSIPKRPSNELIKNIFDSYVELVSQQIPTKSLFDFNNYLDFPDTKAKQIVLERLKKIRKTIPEDKVAFYVKDTAQKLIILATISASRHLEIAKIFTNKEAATKWLEGTH